MISLRILQWLLQYHSDILMTLFRNKSVLVLGEVGIGADIARRFSAADLAHRSFQLRRIARSRRKTGSGNRKHRHPDR